MHFIVYLLITILLTSVNRNVNWNKHLIILLVPVKYNHTGVKCRNGGRWELKTESLN